jgi:hypothetical protein
MATAAASLLALRLAAQQLSGAPAAGPVAVAQRLLAVQAQDPRGVRLAIRARTAGLTAATVDEALTVDRSLVIAWLNRGTLHLVTAEDYWWLQELTAPRMLPATTRRLAQEGVSPAAASRAVEVAERALAGEGPLTRAQLRDRIAAAGVRTEGQALVHLLGLASLRHQVVRGPVTGREQAFVLARDWLGPPPPPLERDVALAELARRYLAGHGPASAPDLAKWAGLPAGDVRRGLAAIGGSLTARPDGLAQLAAQPASAILPPPKLLGAFDPVLLGWAARTEIVGRDGQRIAGGGIIRPIALINGRAAATWGLAGGEVALSPLRPLGGAESAALQAEAADVRRFLGLAARAGGRGALGC